MDKETMLEIAANIGEWNRESDRNRRSELQINIVLQVTRTIEREAELGGWYAEYEEVFDHGLRLMDEQEYAYALVEQGLEQGLVSLKLECGEIAAHIGGTWFWFCGSDDRFLDPVAFCEKFSRDDRTAMIADAMLELDAEEKEYCLCFLQENIPIEPLETLQLKPARKVAQQDYSLSTEQKDAQAAKAALVRNGKDAAQEKDAEVR